MSLSTRSVETRQILDRELRARHPTDYEVVTTDSYEHARAILIGYCAGLAVMFSVSLWALWPVTDA